MREKKEVTYKRLGVKIILDFITATLEARLKWSSTIKVLRENDYTSVFPYVAIIPSKCEGRINKDVFSNERPQKFTSYEQQQKTLSYSGHR